MLSSIVNYLKNEKRLENRIYSQWIEALNRTSKWDRPRSSANKKIAHWTHDHFAAFSSDNFSDDFEHLNGWAFLCTLVLACENRLTCCFARALNLIFSHRMLLGLMRSQQDQDIEYFCRPIQTHRASMSSICKKKSLIRATISFILIWSFIQSCHTWERSRVRPVLDAHFRALIQYFVVGIPHDSIESMRWSAPFPNAKLNRLVSQYSLIP